MIDRKEIKKKSWDISKAHFKEIWMGYGFVLLFIGLINGLTETILQNFPKCLWSFKGGCMVSIGSILSFGVSLLLNVAIAFLMFGVYKYLLNIVRGKKVEFNDIFVYKQDWLKLFGISFVATLLINLGYVFVLPGIILELVYAMMYYVYADKEGDLKETLSESRELMQGYKWDYFIFGLSFIGWILLIGFTFGIAIIWVMPFILIAQTLYYEELKKLKKVKNQK